MTSDVRVRISATDETRRAFSSATQNAQKFRGAANDAAVGTSRFRGNLGQLGYQIQDISVQLQSGQNALLVFGQQGSQIASIFGPGGAVIGAFLAVGAAVATALIPSIMSSKDALDVLQEAFDGVNEIVKKTKDNVIVITDEFGELAKQANQLSQARIKISLGEISEALEAAKNEVIDLTYSLSPGELGGRFSRTNSLVRIFTRDLESGKITLSEYANQVSKLFVGDETSSKEFRDTLKDILDLTDKSNKLKELQGALEGGTKGLITETDQKNLEKFNESVTSFANDRIIALEDSFFSISDSLRKEEEVIEQSYNSRMAVIQAYSQRFPEFQKEASEAEIRLAREKNEALNSLEASRLASVSSFYGQQASILSQGLGENNAIAKAAFVAQKAAAIPQMIVATEQGATQALSLGPIAGPIAAALIKGLGYASIGTVIGQTMASFEGGGFTGKGARIGGVDGRGGKLAVMHPNEKVVDMKDGGDGNGWTVNVNNYGEGKATAKVDDKKRLIEIMVEQASNQSSPFRNAMHTTSNLKPRGTR